MENFFGDWGGIHAWRQLAVSLAWLAGAVLAGLVTHKLLMALLERLAGRTGFSWDNLAFKYARNPARLFLILFFLNLAAPGINPPGLGTRFLVHLMSLLLILSISYALVNTVHFFRELFLAKYDVTISDNLRARKVHTQVGVLEKVLLAVIVILTIAFMLMTFDGVRQVGVSLLASAGIAGIIIGLAAQKSIGNLLAGIQLAITQPIRIDDALLIEGEFGHVEEITLTYVVVRIWDLRRLIIPISRFIEQPFQNWTREGSNLLGTVMLYTDYSVPVEELRREADRLVRSSPLWDGKVSAFQVLECKPDTVELRVLLSARSAGQAFDLRCFVRENMLVFLRDKYPEALPKMRAEVKGFPEPAGSERAAQSVQLPKKPDPVSAEPPVAEDTSAQTARAAGKAPDFDVKSAPPEKPGDR